MALALLDGIEGVEEFFLSGVLARKKLNVIDKEGLGRAVFHLEVSGVLAADAGDDFVGEGFGGGIDDLGGGVNAEQFVTDGLHEVGFSDTDTTPEKEGVVVFAGLLNDSLGGSKGQLVTGGDVKFFQNVIRAQTNVFNGKGDNLFVLFWFFKQRAEGLDFFGCLAVGGLFNDGEDKAQGGDFGDFLESSLDDGVVALVGGFGDKLVRKADFSDLVFQRKELAIFEVEAEVLSANVNLKFAESGFPDG